MKTTLTILLLILMTVPAMAREKEWHGPYAGLSLGGQQLSEMDISGTSLDVDFDPGWSASVSAGYHWPVGLRLEAEGIYLKSEFNKIKSGANSAKIDGSVNMKALMVNTLWEFENDTNWFSYLGLGLGYGKSKVEAFDDSATSTIPLAQPILGAGYRITDHVAMSLEYKYLMGLEKLDYDGVKSDYRAHRLGLGLRYAF